MPKKKASIKWEIALFTTALSVVVIGVLSFFSLDAMKKSLTAEVESRGKSAAASMARSAADFILVNYVLDTAKIMKDALSGKGVKYALVSDPSGTITASDDLKLLKKRYVRPGTFGVTPGGSVIILDDEGNKVIDFTSSVVAKGKLNLGTAHLGISYSIIQEPLEKAYINIGIVALAALLLGIIGSFMLGVAITKPVEALEKGTQIIGRGNMDHIIMIDSSNEIGRLADAFNKMTKDLKTSHLKELQQKTLQRELEIAREIQLSIIPKEIPVIKGYKIHAFYKAAEEVGGDYYDIIPISDDKTGIVVADVSGKGVPAALITAMMSSMMHAEAKDTEDPRLAMLSINSKIRDRIKRGMFVTAFYGILDIDRNNIVMVSAGHNETLMYSAAVQDVISYAPKGFPIAMGPTELMEGRMAKETIAMEPGDKIAVYTDGITEAMNKEGKEYGIDTLIKCLKVYGKNEGEVVIQSIMDDVKKFTAGFAQSDDIALVVIERLRA